MTRNHATLALGTLLAAATVGCTLSSPDKLPEPSLAANAKITILQTTDVHHQANGVGHVTASAPGADGTYARIAAYVNAVRATATNPVVLVDSGDWSMGTYYDLTATQQPMGLYFMDALRYNCATIGNHEFDYTPKGLAMMLSAAQKSFSFRTPMVASNVNLNGNADLAPYIGEGKLITPTRVETLSNGLRVGYIGLMGKVAAASAPTSAPVTFGDFSLDVAKVQTLVNDLRTRQSCHVVIALSHTGANADASAGEDVDLAKRVNGIDVIASGHNHNALATAKSVTNGAWTTKIICAGAYGTNVARIDLSYNPTTKTTSVDASSNAAMNAATMGAYGFPATGDPAFSFIVGSADATLNKALAPLFTQFFPDYDANNPATGLYHTVGASMVPLASNDKNPVLCPNGLGNLSADAVRSVPNGIIMKTLTAVGGNPANLPGYDFTPFGVGMVATGVIRANLAAGVPLSFADVYNVLPLGMSPDLLQSLPVGYPLVSAYMDVADVKKICALQLVAQANLAPSEFYLNLSGLSYSLKPVESNVFFKFATAAAVLNVTSQKAAAGSTAAGAAMQALGTMGTDGGAAMMAAIGAGNAYATAMGKLNDADLSGAATNLQVLGQVAMYAQADAASGTKTLNALIVGKAIAAIDTVTGFAPTDPSCVGATTAITAPRVRIAADLYAVLMMGAAQAEFGADIKAYAAGTGTTLLTAANMPGLLANRIDLDPATAGMQEVKEWMALLVYMVTPPAQGGHFTSGTITTEYSSTANFAQFGTFGAAVQVRNASYPIASIGQLMTTLGGLMAAN